MEKGNIVVLGRGDSKPEIISDVPDKELERLFAKQAPEYGARVKRLQVRIDAIRKEVLADPDLVGEYVQFSLKAAKRDAFLTDDLTLPSRSAEEVQKRVEQYHRYLDVGSLVIYEHIGRKGSFRFLTGSYPNLGWWPYHFNDKASSAVAWGGNILFEHSWYRGRALWLVGFPWMKYDDFNRFGFNEKASSYTGF